MQLHLSASDAAHWRRVADEDSEEQNEEPDEEQDEEQDCRTLEPPEEQDEEQDEDPPEEQDDQQHDEELDEGQDEEPPKEQEDTRRARLKNAVYAGLFASAMKESRAGLMCAHWKCTYMVHSSPEFGGYCCRKCHWKESTQSKSKLTHGDLCEKRERKGFAIRAEGLAPTFTLEDALEDAPAKRPKATKTMPGSSMSSWQWPDASDDGPM